MKSLTMYTYVSGFENKIEIIFCFRIIVTYNNLKVHGAENQVMILTIELFPEIL